jgi:hypothetical protein
LNWKHPKSALRLLGLVASVVALAFFLYKFPHAMSDLPAELNGRHRWSVVLALVGLYLLIYLAISVNWKLLLALCGESVAVARAFEITSISQLYRYVPGNVAQHVGRLALARGAGIDTRRAACSLVLEASSLVVTGLLLALVAGCVAFPGCVTGGRPAYAALATAVAVILLVAVTYVARRVFRCRQRLGGPAESLVLVGCMLIHAAVFVLHGCALLVLLRHVFDVQHASLFAVTGVFAFAWVAGFITPGAPAGVGMREAMLTIALAPVCGEPTAAVCAGSLRLVSMLGDGLAFVAGVAARHLRMRTPHADLASDARR